jgi:hypothetical protein
LRAAATLLVAAQANAAEILMAQPQEVAEIAGIIPVFYGVFLVGSLGFTLAVVSALKDTLFGRSQTGYLTEKGCEQMIACRANQVWVELAANQARL